MPTKEKQDLESALEQETRTAKRQELLRQLWNIDQETRPNEDNSDLADPDCQSIKPARKRSMSSNRELEFVDPDCIGA